MVGGEHETPLVGSEAFAKGGEVEGELLGLGVGEVRLGAGPGPIISERDDVGAHGIAFHVADGSPGVGFVEGAGEEAVLPKVAVAGEGGIHVLGIAAVEPTEGAGEGVAVFGDDDPVDVVGH